MRTMRVKAFTPAAPGQVYALPRNITNFAVWNDSHASIPTAPYRG